MELYITSALVEQALMLEFWFKAVASLSILAAFFWLVRGGTCYLSGMGPATISTEWGFAVRVVSDMTMWMLTVM